MRRQAILQTQVGGDPADIRNRVVPETDDEDTTNLLSASIKKAYTPLVYDAKEYAPLKKVWGDQLIDEIAAAGKPWNNPQVMKQELNKNFLGTFHDIEEAMANLFEDQKDSAFIKKFRKPGTKEIDWTAVASKVVSPNHGLPYLFVVAIPGAGGDVHVFVRDSRKKRAAYAATAAGEGVEAPEAEKVDAIDHLDDIVKLVAKKLPVYRTKFMQPLGYKEVEKDLVAELGISADLASLISPAINLRADAALIASAFKADLMKILKSPKAKSAVEKVALDHVLEQYDAPTRDAKAEKDWDSPYCNNIGNERESRDSSSITSAIKQHKEPKFRPPQEQNRTSLDNDIRKEQAKERKENKDQDDTSINASLEIESELLTSHVGMGVSPSSLLLRRR